ncbi:DUF262 domain-containing protein [Pseudomonas fluorescens]|uniref:DUF262 domain-containing protein n=1 Tax=Pseudomonas fluorescens TaxID=294 RepID=UPI0012428026|nr:DUF262 domain-containing protein [Pseudomonas fluorescens]VVN46254.1 hypothetical protein PS676_05768 [Pseudomonas fluorescens]
MSAFGSRINYKQLLDRHGRIRIPIIQRDYAQGRPEEDEVREDFLQAIEGALEKPADDPSLPFNLDFIYGSIEGDDETRFLPLDGQQRLTTLFLLHWYLAWVDGQWECFAGMFRANEKSRFSYSVRPSSNEFFDALVIFMPDESPADLSSLTALITDQPWYFRSWRLDPTIQSVLFMLDAIHARFVSSSNLFERLISESQPAITFQLLDLENYGLSDDLYIKMNSRGKPLTPFETFKARYERELKEQFADQSYECLGVTYTTAEYIAWRMDNAWADLFWNARDKASNQYDGAIMNVFRTVALATRQPDSHQFLEDIERFRQGARAPTYSDFHSRNWLDDEFTLSLISLLDAWSGDSDGLRRHLPSAQYFDEQEFFDRIVIGQKALSNTEVVQFAAYVLFLDFHEGGSDSGQFQDWMRVVFNLSENTEYNRTEDLQRSMSGLRDLLPQSNDILEYFANADSSVSGFSRQQIEEERLKAQLILAKAGWPEHIYRAEAHGYFRGQIDFLLDYSGIKSDLPVQSWDDQQHREFQEKFKQYFGKASAMFGERGLIELPSFRWERALLCIGDYLLPKGSRNESFLVNSTTDQASWKRLLRGGGGKEPQAREVLRQLLDRINVADDLAPQLDELIAGATGLAPWIEALVQSPEAIAYCRSRCMRFDPSGQIYLLSKTQMNGMHAELFTYSLYHILRDDIAKYSPLKLWGYSSVSETEVEPRFFITLTKNKVSLQFSVGFEQGSFVMQYENFGAGLTSNITNALCDLKFMEDGDLQVWTIDREEIESWLLELAASVATDEVGEVTHD